MSDFSPVQSSPTTAGSWILLVAQSTVMDWTVSIYLNKMEFRCHKLKKMTYVILLVYWPESGKWLLD